MMLFFRISVQLTVEHLIAHAICNSSAFEQLPVYFCLITGRIQLDCWEYHEYIGRCSIRQGD